MGRLEYGDPKCHTKIAEGVYCNLKLGHEGKCSSEAIPRCEHGYASKGNCPRCRGKLEGV